MIETNEAHRGNTRAAGVPRTAWPDWHPWSLESRPTIDRLTSSLEYPYSDVSFGSCYAWDVDDEAAWTTVNGNLVLRLPDYATRRPVYVLAGTHQPGETARLLLRSGLCSQLRFVPACVAEACASDSAFDVAESRDDFDYVYNVRQLGLFDEPGLAGKRRARARFRRDSPEHRVQVDRGPSLREPLVLDSLLTLFDSWATTAAPSEDPASERAALQRLLKAAEHFDLVLVRLFANGQLVAFVLDELLPGGWAMGHFMKADRRCRDAFVEVQFQEMQAIADMGAHLLNNEQDLGLPGLRQSKLSWRPERLLPKYTITLAPQASLLQRAPTTS